MIHSGSAMKRCRTSHIEEDLTHGSIFAYLPEEVVAEIVLRLPIKSLFRFSSVSKRWKSTISSPIFAHSYMKQSNSRLLALLHPFSSPVKDLSDIDHQVSIKNVLFVSLPNDNDNAGHYIRGSSKGLVLSTIHPTLGAPAPVPGGRTLCVTNPLTKQIVHLPHPTVARACGGCVCGVVVRSETPFITTYKVVVIERVYPDLNPWESAETSVEIFSSDTGSWAAWKMSCPAQVFSRPVKPCFVYKGVLHWLSRYTGTLTTYDPYNSPGRFGSIALPNSPKYLHTQHWAHVLYSGGDLELLKLCEILLGEANKLRVWRLQGEGDWCLELEFSIPSPYDDTVDTHCRMLQLVAPNHDLPSFHKHCTMLQVAPNPELICASGFKGTLIPVELCPWSSPSYNTSARPS